MKSGAVSCTQQGLILHIDGTNTLEVSASGDVALFISAGEQERDLTSGLVAGGSVGYYTLGGVLMVASKAEAYTVGGFVYVGDDGLATNDATGNKKLGIYVGATGITVAAAGDLIPVDTSFAEKV
jgi:hypothetical protein